MKRIFLIGLVGFAVLIPCVAQQVPAAEGLGTRYESQDTGLYASHATFPFGTQVAVTNLENNKAVIVQIGGRIPADRQWIIAVSAAAADTLEMNSIGTTKVRIQEIPNVATRKTIRKFMQTGPASWRLAGTGFIANHPSLPLTSKIRITNKANGRQAIATIVGRFHADGTRIIDLSQALAQNLGLGGAGVVLIESVDKDTEI